MKRVIKFLILPLMFLFISQTGNSNVPGNCDPASDYCQECGGQKDECKRIVSNGELCIYYKNGATASGC